MSAPTVRLPVTARFRVVPTRSTASFRTKSLFGLVTVPGSFSITEGRVDVDNGVARLTAVLDATSVNTANQRRDKDLRSTRFLDTEQFSELRFEGTFLPGDAVARGRLTVHGTTVDVELAIDGVVTEHERTRVRASTRIDRTAHGITAGKGMVGRYTDVELDIVLVTG